MPGQDAALAVGLPVMLVHMVPPPASPPRLASSPAPLPSPLISPCLPRPFELKVLGVINPAGASGREQSALVRTISLASPIKWCVEGLCCAELRGMELDRASLAEAPRMGGLALVTSGDQVLERLGLEGQSCGRCLARLGTVLGAEVGVALLGLALTRPRFQRLEGTAPPVPAQL